MFEIEASLRQTSEFDMFAIKPSENCWHPLAPFKVLAERVFLNFLVPMVIGTLG